MTRLAHVIWPLQMTDIRNLYCPVYGAFDLGLAVSVPLPIVTGIFVLHGFRAVWRNLVKKLFVIFLFIADQAIIIFAHES